EAETGEADRDEERDVCRRRPDERGGGEEGLGEESGGERQASEPSEAEPAREAAGEERPDQRRRRLHEEDRPVRGVGEPVRGLEHGAARRKAHDDEALHERRSVDRRDARDPRDSDASAHSPLLAAYAGAARSLPRSACNRRGGSGVPTGLKGF